MPNRDPEQLATDQQAAHESISMNTVPTSSTRERGVGTLHLKVDDKLVAIHTHTVLAYHDGFSFGVDTELQAFQAAYVYRHSKNTRVDLTASGWRVSVYRHVPA